MVCEWMCGRRVGGCMEDGWVGEYELERDGGAKMQMDK